MARPTGPRPPCGPWTSTTCSPRRARPASRSTSRRRSTVTNCASACGSGSRPPTGRTASRGGGWWWRTRRSGRSWGASTRRSTSRSRAHPRRRPRVPDGQAVRPDHVVDRVAGRAPRRGAGARDPLLRALHGRARGRPRRSSSRRPTGRSSRRCGTSSSRCTPRGWAPASPRCTSCAKPRCASCSASPRATCRAACSRWVDCAPGRRSPPRPRKSLDDVVKLDGFDGPAL